MSDIDLQNIAALRANSYTAVSEPLQRILPNYVCRYLL